MKSISILGIGIGLGICLVVSLCIVLPVAVIMKSAADRPSPSEPPRSTVIWVNSVPSELEFHGEVDYRESDRSTHKKQIGPFHTPKKVIVYKNVYKGLFCLHSDEVGNLSIRVYDNITLVHEGTGIDLYQTKCVEFDLR